MTPEQSAVVRDLADGCSTQARIANRTWLSVIAVSVLLLMPAAPAPENCPPVAAVPLLRSVPAAQFVPIAFAMLAILVIALSAAHAEHVRADALAHDTITGMGSTEGLPPRALLDILRVPGFTRVAPIALWVRGGWAQQGKQARVKSLRRVASGLLYLLLKIVVIVVLFAVPGLSLWQSYDLVQGSALSQTVTTALGVLKWIALLSLVLVGLADMRNTWTRVRKFFVAAT